MHFPKRIRYHMNNAAPTSAPLHVCFRQPPSYNDYGRASEIEVAKQHNIAFLSYNA